MNRPPAISIVIAVTMLAFVPALIALGLYELPSLTEIRASHTADILGVWVMTWGLIVLGIAAALTVSWLAWTAEAAALRLEGSPSVDAPGSFVTPTTPHAAGRTAAQDSALPEGLPNHALRTPSNSWRR